MPGNMPRRSWGRLSSFVSGEGGGGTLLKLVNDLFMNPFQALAEGKFLSIIVFSILFGIAVRTVIEESGGGKVRMAAETLLDVFGAAMKACFRMIDWIMEYFPVGVFALTAVNFAAYGAELFGPYLRIAGCVITGVLIMIGVIYPLFVLVICRENPYRVLAAVREPVLTAFLTRSSAAALPVSLRVADEELHIRNELSGFALPLGATINMDGVCIHLPVFAILAANIFGIPLGMGQIFVLILSVVFASIGTGGIPGGSIFRSSWCWRTWGSKPAGSPRSSRWRSASTRCSTCSRPPATSQATTSAITSLRAATA